MSRIRSIHPGFFTDEAFVQVSAFARLLLLGLGVEADDQGTFAWKPVTLKMRLFPIDPVDIQKLLKELEQADAIRRYRDGEGREFGAIRNFRLHQRPKSPNSINFLPDDFRNYVGLSSGDFGNEETLSPANSAKGGNAPAGEGRGGERRGEKGRGEKGNRGAKLPNSFEPILTDEAKAIVADWSPSRFANELAKFRDHHTAKGSVMKDWQAAFRTWLRNAKEWEKPNARADKTGASGLFGACTE